MSCTLEDAYSTVQEKPSLAMAVAGTPVGFLGLLFFIFTSMEGVKSLTQSNSILAIFKESLKGIMSLVNITASKAKDARTFGKKELAIWAFTLFATAAVLLGFATDSIGWLSITFAVLILAIFIAVIFRFGSPGWLRAVLGGIIVGASTATVVFLIRQVDTWSSRMLIPDVLFIFVISYFILAGLALWNTYLPALALTSPVAPKREEKVRKTEDSATANFNKVKNELTEKKIIMGKQSRNPSSNSTPLRPPSSNSTPPSSPSNNNTPPSSPSNKRRAEENMLDTVQTRKPKAKKKKERFRVLEN